MFKSFIKLFKNKSQSPRFRIVVNKLGEYRVQALGIIYSNSYGFVDSFVFKNKKEAIEHLKKKKDEIEQEERMDKLRRTWRVVE